VAEKSVMQAQRGLESSVMCRWRPLRDVQGWQGQQQQQQQQDEEEDDSVCTVFRFVMCCCVM
jgi:hypothetical protein